MQSNFARCMDHVFAYEGGYVNHPRDPGGATNMGITIHTLREWRGRPVTPADVKNLTKAEAMRIYRAKYWDKVRGDDLPAGLDLVAFDAAVNSGPRRGARWLQSALGVKADGVIGPATLQAAISAEPKRVIKTALQARMQFLRSLSTWDVFGKGWTRRVQSVEAIALDMASSIAQPQSWLAALIEAILSIFRIRQ